jgi:hypothetical protein
MENNPYEISGQSSQTPVSSQITMANNPYETQKPTTSPLESQIGDQTDNGKCQAWVEKETYGKTGIFPSAASAWNSYIDTGQAHSGDKGVQPGDILYFGPDKSNGGFGHTGIVSNVNPDGGVNFVSATYNGVEESTLSDWQKSTGQKYLGFVKP